VDRGGHAGRAVRRGGVAVKTYRGKEVRAVQWTGRNDAEMLALIGDRFDQYGGGAVWDDEAGWCPIPVGTWVVELSGGALLTLSGAEFQARFEPKPLIGPLTAEEWCELRSRGDDDLLQCCGITSDFRDEVFRLLRMGGEEKWGRDGFRAAYWRMVDHGLPSGRGGELIAKLVAYFLGDPPEPKQPFDDMTTELKARQDANEGKPS
jgi:hypothetical protein